jgi:hypothetical protein
LLVTFITSWRTAIKIEWRSSPGFEICRTNASANGEFRPAPSLKKREVRRGKSARRLRRNGQEGRRRSQGTSAKGRTSQDREALKAAQEEEKRRRAQTAKENELQKLEDARKAREGQEAEAKKKAEEAQNAVELRRLQEAQRAADLELKKLQGEVRATRDAAAKAEERRLAAEKAASRCCLI